jgi:hypothetical protein
MAPAKAARNYDLAKSAYDIYRNNRKKVLPKFNDLKQEEKEAWEATAEGILQNFVNSIRGTLKNWSSF